MNVDILEVNREFPKCFRLRRTVYEQKDINTLKVIKTLMLAGIVANHVISFFIIFCTLM